MVHFGAFRGVIARHQLNAESAAQRHIFLATKATTISSQKWKTCRRWLAALLKAWLYRGFVFYLFNMVPGFQKKSKHCWCGSNTHTVSRYHVGRGLMEEGGPDSDGNLVV